MPPPLGYRQTKEHRAAIQAGVQKAYLEGRGVRRQEWEVPPELQEMFEDLKRKLGAGCARKLVRDHYEKKGCGNGRDGSQVHVVGERPAEDQGYEGTRRD